MYVVCVPKHLNGKPTPIYMEIEETKELVKQLEQSGLLGRSLIFAFSKEKDAKLVFGCVNSLLDTIHIAV